MPRRISYGLFVGRSAATAGLGAALLIAGPALPADESGGVGPQSGDPAARLISVPDSNVMVRVWDERNASGAASHYSLDLGAGFSEPRATSYSLMLRYGEFDPLGDAPAPLVDESLAAGPDTNLYIVQFVTQPLEVYREQLRELGAQVHSYLPYHSHVVMMDESVREAVEELPYVRWVGEFHPAYKLDELILEALEQGAADDLLADYSIQATTRGLAGQQKIGARIEDLGGSVMNVAPDGFRMTVTMTLAQLREIVRMDEALFVDPWGPGELDMDVVRQLTGASTVLAPAGYTGQGVRGEVFDTGTQNGHPEWGGTPVLYHGPAGGGSHGTSVYGVCFAVGVNPQATGTNPDYERGISNFYNNSTQFGGPTTRLAQNTAATNPAGPYRSVFQTSSVGSPRTTQYTTISAETDDYLFMVDYLSCQSMSNAFLTPDTRPQAWAKNIIGVGGITHNNSLNRATHSSSGSTGPAADGRIKPDLAAMYDNIFTTTSGSSYTQFGGTSGATPIICSHSGLVQQMWHEGVFPGHGGGGSVFDSRPKSTTAKAMMINTAYRYDWNSGGSNANMWRVRQGWGMVDVANLYDLRNDIIIIDESEVLSNLQTYSRVVTVTAAQEELNATMVYIDPAGVPFSSVHRINDLSLKLTSPSNVVYWGNNGLMSGNWSTSGGAANTLDTVENVFVQNPEAGNWTVEVIASEINQDSHLETPQVDADFALVLSGVIGVLPCPGDINGDGVIDVLDLLEVLSNWGPCPTDEGDALGDVTLAPVDIEAQTGETGNLGVDYLNDTYYVSARGTVTPPHRVYTFDSSGTMTGNFEQDPAVHASAWGYRDGTNDGALLYFGNENGIFSHNPDGTNPQTVIAGAGPNGNWRALAYDPTGDGGNGSFWSANFDSNLVEVTRTGAVLNTFPNLDGWSLYGLEIDPRNGNLWGHHGVRPAGGHPPPEVREIDTTTGRETGVSFQSDAGVPGTAPDPPLNGGLTMVPGGAGDGQLDTVVMLQAASDSIVGFEIDGVPPCPADVNNDLVVDVLDLLVILTDWGPCP